MAVDSPPAWIRSRPRLTLSAPWHLLQTVTPAGIRVTSCAEVLVPDDDVEIGADDDAGERCSVCSQHHDDAG